ncbi:unnamed protein product [Calicophoron daubneyi]|uniref:Glycerophosphocholine acyltransferase 1 n=1 Tax=Calicophoron daubneyi TaxID=300641 RepID=A0AAV2TFN5_CALDB
MSPNCSESHIGEKLCFVGSAMLMMVTVYSFVFQPAVILYLFSILFILTMAIRVYSYWKANYLLFMLDMCYFANILSLLFVWAFPRSQEVQCVQFGLANAHAYCGAFIFRNALVLHDFQKLVSVFIHILPPLFSYLVRWLPEETSRWWYTDLINSGAIRGLLDWNGRIDWFWLMLVPFLLFTLREVLYFTIIYGCVKPDEKHLDSYRYLRRKKYMSQFLWNRISMKWHVLVWILLGMLLSACALCVAVVAWSNYLFHSAMLIIQLVMITWNGACYYLDYYPLEFEHRSSVIEVADGGQTSNSHLGAAASVSIEKDLEQKVELSPANAIDGDAHIGNNGRIFPSVWADHSQDDIVSSHGLSQSTGIGLLSLKPVSEALSADANC